jgi:hypothetical protein
MPRTLALLLVAGLALSACGDDSGTAAAPVTVDTARLHAMKRLTPAQYRALERIYVASVEFEDVSSGSVPSKAQLDRATRPLIAACERLDAADPLLGVLRASCPSAAAVYGASADLLGCTNDDECRDAARAGAQALRDLVAGGRVEARAIRATRLARACRRVLVAPAAAQEVYAALEAALEALVDALDSGSDEDQAAAAQALADVDVDALPKPRPLLRRLRAACR